MFYINNLKTTISINLHVVYPTQSLPVFVSVIFFHYQEIKELKFEAISQEGGVIKCRYS